MAQKAFPEIGELVTVVWSEASRRSDGPPRGLPGGTIDVVHQLSGARDQLQDNPRRVPDLEASAARGLGVFETLRAVGRLALAGLKLPGRRA